jgi:four helix bundle protein
MKAESENIVLQKSKAFAIRCIRLNQYLQREKKEYCLSNQLIRSGTSIGANAKEAIRAQSLSDFRSKLYISLKEASETEYWLELLRDTEFITNEQASSILNDCIELIKIITSILKSTNRQS